MNMYSGTKHDIVYDDDFIGNGSMDVDTVMRRMDAIHDSKFCEWIRNEENCSLIGVHLNRIASSFNVRRVANGLRWVTLNWTTAGVTKLLQAVTKGWAISPTGELVNYVTADWSLKPYTELVIREFVKPLTASESARFVHTVTEDWDIEAVSELVSILGRELNWDPKYFQDFTLQYIISNNECQGNSLKCTDIRLALQAEFSHKGANSDTRERFQKAVEFTNTSGMAVIFQDASTSDEKVDVRRRFSYPQGIPGHSYTPRSHCRNTSGHRH
eukprot:Sdes_comp11234_c0_seq1m2732